MIVTVDASVVIKWLLQDPRREAGTDTATELMRTIIIGEQPVLQPMHWLAEVAAVLARETPITAPDDVLMLTGLELPATGEPHFVRRAVELAIELKQHVFDTLYHAVAFENPESLLITADERYLRAAGRKGQIVDLMDWKLPA